MTKTVEIGIVFDGSIRNQYSMACEVADFAESYGYRFATHLRSLALNANMTVYLKAYDVANAHAELDAELDSCIEWLNENVATDDGWFGFYNGDLFYQTENWWNDN